MFFDQPNKRKELSVRIISFEEILWFRLPKSEKSEQSMRLSVDSKFNWPFFVDTKERKFEFYAQSEI